MLTNSDKKTSALAIINKTLPMKCRLSVPGLTAAGKSAPFFFQINASITKTIETDINCDHVTLVNPAPMEIKNMVKNGAANQSASMEPAINSEMK